MSGRRGPDHLSGCGSASFDPVHELVERFPAIPGPSWVKTAAQPFAVEDVIEYPVAVTTLKLVTSAVFEIFGGDQTSYAEVMREYARQRNRRRPMIRLPPVNTRSLRVLAAC